MDDPELNAETVWAALETGVAFWDALATDDSRALEPLLASNVLQFVDANGGLEAAPATIRDHLGITQEECGHIGWYSTLSVLFGNDLRISYTVTGDEGRHVEAGELLEGWRIEFTWSEGAWLVDPVRPHDNAIGTVDVERHQE